MNTNVLLAQKFPHVFDEFTRSLGMLPQEKWRDYVPPEHHPEVDKLLEEIHTPATRSLRVVGNTNFTNNFNSGMFVG